VHKERLNDVVCTAHQMPLGLSNKKNLEWAGNVGCMVADERCVQGYGGGT
jgi:hypothetical protein